ncbi:EboA domain-containing protein [Streptomyces viridochromogenes]|uniref:EboA domain-containing protein n=1 Tax=Streptomyces viridochromogenes TaxID=1938 RepID=UPI0007C6DB02|nr:EboA domain-containing protein [Streptomyces viridochromogenes]
MAVTTASLSAPPDPHPALIAVLDPTTRTWLDESAAEVAAEPAAVRRLFPAVRRRCGHGRMDHYWTVDEAARAVLITALPLRGQELADEVTRLHRHGDPAERRAVLRTLPLLDLGDLALPLVREALRGNDTTLIEAALGPYAAARLPDAEFRQAVLKCVFCGIPLDRVTGLGTRADRELARMLADFAQERIVAGRDVPQDIGPVVRAFPDIVGAELDHALQQTLRHAPTTDPLADVFKEEG